MSVYKYPKFKILIDPKSKKTQGLRMGDVVRRQYFDAPTLIYSLMVVLETGIDLIGEAESPYFIGALIEGSEPQTGELLDFIRVTNLFNADRGGALYLTTSDSDAPYMEVIDGLAIENSLCFPYMAGGIADIPDRNKYACQGEKYLDISYKESEIDTNRILRITRNTLPNNVLDPLGIKQSIGESIEHPQRLIISYKIRASEVMENIPVSLGYTDGREIDGCDFINIDTLWQYKLHLITIDFPAKYQRSFFIALTDHLKINARWCEIADLNIVLASDITNFANATKARVGKIKGIVDPVFGVLDGYGAYFQNLYATKNVNIAGTLTAGDENGFSSTFYVGKIHKNVIQNSIECPFVDVSSCIVPEKSPVGIGNVWKLGTYAKMSVQSVEWRDSHLDQQYCFSAWIKSDKDVTMSLYLDEYPIRDIEVTGNGEWKRYYASFYIHESKATELCIRLDFSVVGVMLSSPQMENGTTPSQYQPTDGTLSYVEDYGAWFAKGGIGGTIQNPLLRLNEDGSISSRDNAFVIHPDGTGHFASGRFKWTKNTITLQDVTIKWEDLNEEAQKNLKPITVEIVSNHGFIIKNGNNDVNATAKVYRDGKELDANGTFYSYTWSLWNSFGTSIVRTYTGKSITIDKKDVINNGILKCEVLES